MFKKAITTEVEIYNKASRTCKNLKIIKFVPKSA